MRNLTKYEKNTLQNIITSIDEPTLLGDTDRSMEFIDGVATAMEFFAYLVDDNFGHDFMMDFFQKVLDNNKHI